MAWNGLNYYSGTNAEPSAVDAFGKTRAGAGIPARDQLQTFKYLKKAIIQSRKEQYFMPLASVIGMPKHFGKEIKVHEYIPLLDDRNNNDQGIFADGVTTGLGNLYGSSKDVGTITDALPILREEGGRVNRVGFTRIVRTGSIQKFGFFTEFTQEALDFDSDEELMDHLSRELMNGAVQLTEAVLQRDLLAAAGTVWYSGVAAVDTDIHGNGVNDSTLSYNDFVKLDQMLTENRTPRQTKVITGSRMIDTKVIPAARVAFLGSELKPWLKQMEDNFSNPAFIEVQHYADAATTLNGEIGAIDSFRIVEVPEMLHWAHKGAVVSNGSTPFRYSHDGTNNRFDIYPVLVVGDDSFTTVGFQTDGKTVKFNVLTRMPGPQTADYNDPYGETGFSSIKWYYGILIKRPERIGLIKCVAPA